MSIMSKEKFMKKECMHKITYLLFVCSMVVVLCGVFFSGLLKKELSVRGVSLSDTTSYVSVGELFNVNTETFYKDNYDTLLKYITGNSSATIDDVSTLASSLLDAEEIRNFTLESGTQGNVNYANKSSGQDVVVRLAGLDWQVMYLSKDKDNNTILTLWLDNSFQEAWTLDMKGAVDRDKYKYVSLNTLNSSDEYAGLIGRWIYRWTYSAKDSYEKYPLNMYGTSYMNACVLNNGGDYLADTAGSRLSSATQNSSHPLAVFTMEEFGLVQHMVTPRKVEWQEFQNVNDYGGAGLNWSNNAWSTAFSDEDFNNTFNINYAGIEKSDAWADSWLWLPSNVEVDAIWKSSINQILNYDGEDEDGRYALRTTGSTRYISMAIKSVDGEDMSNQGEGNMYVRPALHLNLNSIEESLTSEKLLSQGNIELNEQSSSYDASNKQLEVTVSVNGNVLTEGEDYKLKYVLNGKMVSNIKDAGTYTILAISINDLYGGYLSTEYVVNPKDVSGVTTTNFSDKIQSPNPEGGVVSYCSVYDGTKLLKENTDYIKNYSNNTSIGMASLEIVGIGNYCGTKVLQFEIMPYVLFGQSYGYVVRGFEENVTYTGEAFVPSLVVMDEIYEFYENIHYQLSYRNNVNVGTATIVITGINYCTGELEVSFNILPLDLSDASITVSDIDNVTYTGDEITPLPSVTHNDRVLQKDVDYVLTYENNMAVTDTATMTITGIGNFEGTITKTFSILTDDITNGEYLIREIVCNDEGVDIVADLKVGDRTLIKDVDYTVDCVVDNLTQIATATISGINNYTGNMVVRHTFIKEEDSSLALEDIGKTDFGVDGEFVSVYDINVENNEDIVVKFKPNVEDFSNLKIYKLVDDVLVDVSFVDLGDGMVSVNCSASEKLYVFKMIDCEEDNNSIVGVVVIIVITSIVVLATAGLVTYLIIAKKRRGNGELFINEQSQNQLNTASINAEKKQTNIKPDNKVSDKSKTKSAQTSKNNGKKKTVEKNKNNSQK